MSDNFLHTFDEKIELSASTAPFISYLHYDNARPIVSELTLRSLDGKVHGDLNLKVRLVSAQTPFSESTQSGSIDVGPASLDVALEIKLLPQLFSAIKSNQLAEIEFELFSGDISLGIANCSTELYPLNVWRNSRETMVEDSILLAAFSQPADPAITSVLTRAREIKATKKHPSGRAYTASTGGYQGDIHEITAEVESIYEAIQELGIQYSNPLPNFNIDGQPIRSASEIVKDKSATCLDTAMFMASCLEAISLHPIVALVPSHAFVGVFTREDQHQNAVLDLLDYAGLVTSDLLLITETTTLCVDEKLVSFHDSQVEVRKWIDAEYDPFARSNFRRPDIRLALDIFLARRQIGIRPLPSVNISKTGDVTVIQSELPKIEFNFTGTTATPRVSLRDDKAPERVKIWKTSLLDMTFNNPLLNRDRRIHAKVAIPKGKLGQIEDLLQQPNSILNLGPLAYGETPLPLSVHTALKEKDEEFINQLLVTKKMIGVSGTERTFVSLMKKLVSASRSSIQQTGSNNLYMTFGSLTWDKDPDSPGAGQVTSPLFLLPVLISSLGKGQFTLQLDDSEEATPNETLALALAAQNINIPLLSNPEFDGAGFDIPGLIAQVREQVNVVNKKASWVVAEDSTIGTYDFSNFHIWKDLASNWSEFAKVPLVKHLIDTDGTKPFVDENAVSEKPTVDEIDAEIEKLPIPSDETQVRAILKSISGESFIIQGPPGTGKSQTITNLLARNLQLGKRVLFMSEKPAALAVVKTRLDQIGLGPFVLDLHDKGTKPSNIKNQLLEALDASAKVDKAGLDAAAAEYDTALRTLASYPGKIHDVDPIFKESVFSARNRMLAIPGNETLSLSREILNLLNGEKLRDYLTSLRDLPQLGEIAGTYSTNFWSFATGLKAKLDSGSKDTLKELLTKLNQHLRVILTDAPSQKLLQKIENLDSLVALESLDSESLPNVNELAVARSSDGFLNLNALKKSLEKLEATAAKSGVFQIKLAKIDIGQMQNAISEAKSATFFKGKKLDAVAQSLNQYLASPITKDQIDQTFSEICNIVALVEKVSQALEKTVGLGVSPEVDLFDNSHLRDIKTKISNLDFLLTATDKDSGKNAAELLDVIAAGEKACLKALGSIGATVLSLASVLEFSSDSIQAWAGEKTFGEALSEAAPKWLDDSQSDFRPLTRWLAVYEVLGVLTEPSQKPALQQVLEGSVKYDAVPNAFERSYLSLLFQRLLDNNDLHNFDGTNHDLKVAQLDRALNSLRKANQSLVASEVVQARKFDTSSSVGVSGALRAELSKSKSQLSVRKLIHRYWDTITQVAPIVAASPDSVARFLSVDSSKFDLVVFDEASQIRVATAIGALGRSKQAIIVGDSRQMPPTALFRKADGSSEEDYLEEDSWGLNDQESILSMAEVSKIPSEMLTWHYRSQDEILIAFSNKEIYEGKLSSFPSPRFGLQPLSERKLRFEYEKDNFYVSRAAKGKNVGEAGTNLSEAKRVVKEIQKRTKKVKTGALSLGVITMNEQQRKLIEDLLDGLEDPQLNRLRNNEIYPEDYIFVRALERVQGDERDTIFFSLGFASEKKGEKMGLQFGPLTRAGSERRLNVAITRSRQEMVVFSSFLPSEMNLSETSSRGMRLLKKFLEFASQGSIDLNNATTELEIDRHRADIARALRDAGLEVMEKVGLSKFKIDIAIADPRDRTRCILAILLDGENWRARQSSADREVLPTTVLKRNMKWPDVARIWLPMWLSNSEMEVKRIKATVDALVAADELKLSQASEVEAEDRDEEAIDINELQSMAEVQIAEEQELPASGKTSALGVNIDEIPHLRLLRDEVIVPDKKYIQYVHDPRIQAAIADLVGQLTATEGPVSPKRAVNFVAKCFGLKSVQTARHNEILNAISPKQFPRDQEGFIFPEGITPKKYTKWAKQDDASYRALSDISLTELANAMVTICSKTAGMESAELSKQVSLAFGNKKLTALLEKRLFDAEKIGVVQGKLRKDANGITYPA